MSDSNNLIIAKETPKDLSIKLEKPNNLSNLEDNKKISNDRTAAPINDYNPFKMTDKEINDGVEANLVLPNFVKKKTSKGNVRKEKNGKK